MNPNNDTLQAACQFVSVAWPLSADQVFRLYNEVETALTHIAPEGSISDATDDLPFRRDDIKRGLILFRTSNNAHGYTNFVSLTAKVDALPQIAKDELASLMRSIANGLSPASEG